MAEPNTMHHPRWNYRPLDNDGDGRIDEDPEEDINGDGEISLMRRLSSQGRWKIGEDPRLLLRCQEDEPAGGWELLGYEGIDNDGDGLVNEDGNVDEAERLRWVDREFHDEGWVNWTLFHHPTLGDIEIGGTFKKFVRRATPGKYLEQLAMTMNDWSLYIADHLPKVSITSLTVQPVAAVSASFSGRAGEEGGSFVIQEGKTHGQGLGHANIATVQSYHTSGGFLYQLLAAEKPSVIPEEDRAVFRLIAEAYTKATGNEVRRPYRERGPRPGPYGFGIFIDWAYMHFGAYSGTI